MEIYLILILFVIGVANGFYSGLLGTGGNVILIPAFDIVLGMLGVPESEIVQFIIAHSLFVTIFNGSLVSFGHYKHGNMAFDRVFQIALPAIVAGYLVTHFIKTSSWYQKTTFDWIFLGLVILITIRYLFFRSTNRLEQDQPALLNHFGAYSILGLFTGVTTALSGFGGGTVVIPSLTDIFGFPIRKASSVSIGVVTLLAIGITISYYKPLKLLTPRLNSPCSLGTFPWDWSFPFWQASVLPPPGECGSREEPGPIPCG